MVPPPLHEPGTSAPSASVAVPTAPASPASTIFLASSTASLLFNDSVRLGLPRPVLCAGGEGGTGVLPAGGGAGVAVPGLMSPSPPPPPPHAVSAVIATPTNSISREDKDFFMMSPRSIVV